MPILTNNLFSSKIIGKNEAKQDNDIQTLQKFAGENNPVLLKISTVFPFTPFPDTIKIDLQKVSIIHTDFFWTHRDQSINFEDILGVSVESGPLFATLIITTRFFSQKPISIRYLLTAQARVARQIIHGLMTVAKQKIKIEETDRNKIIDMLIKIGTIR